MAKFPKNITIELDINGMSVIARRIAEFSKSSDVITLRGELGSGKTTFARAFIRYFLRDDMEITSPTFNIVQIYNYTDAQTGKAGEIWHFDLYRLNSTEEILEIGLEEAMENAICLIEWPDKAKDLLPDDRIEIKISRGKSEHKRILNISFSKNWVARFLDNTKREIASSSYEDWENMLKDITK